LLINVYPVPAVNVVSAARLQDEATTTPGLLTFSVLQVTVVAEAADPQSSTSRGEAGFKPENCWQKMLFKVLEPPRVAVTTLEEFPIMLVA
jgi:hypothetical protein